MTLARWSPRLGWARFSALAVCVGIGLAFVYANVRSWELEDAEAYWQAGVRLSQGAPLYVPVDPGADEMIAYRYAPWLAWIWVPLTSLPKVAVLFGWSVLMIGAVIVALAPLARLRSVAAICLLFLLGGLMIRTASTGNVHALMIAALVWGAPRRGGPVAIALAASLKIVPILFALVYAGRGEWRRVAVTLALTALLWLPALWYSLDDYPAEAGESLSLLSLAGPIAWGLLAVAASAFALRFARTRYAWVACSGAVIATIPRLAYYDLTYLLVVQTHQKSITPGSTRKIGSAHS